MSDAPQAGAALVPGPIPKTALVTGAAKRIGREIARDLASLGFSLAVHHNNSPAEAESLVAEIEAAGGRAVALAADLAKESEVAALISRAVRELGPLGCLVNNASRFEVDDFSGATRESWDINLETNLRAPFVLTQGFAAQLPAGAEGAVINLIDQRVWNLTPYFTSYTVSKAGLWTLTQTMALALAPYIRINAIGPGPVLPSARQTQERFEEQCRAMPLRRGASTAEICAAVRFLLAARSMTGQMIALDGGQHLGWAQASRGVVAEE
jgi:NAD(P)-dependent dehydrogenase (short-subunit alcohol dehydrogenase family)